MAFDLCPKCLHLGRKINGKEHLDNNQPGDDKIDMEFNFEQLGLLDLSCWWAIKIDLGHCWVTKSEIVCCWWAIEIDLGFCSVTERGILNRWWATKMNLGFWREIEIDTYWLLAGNWNWYLLAIVGRLKLIPILYWCVIKREVLNHWQMTEMDLGCSLVAKILKFWKVLIIWQWTWIFLKFVPSLRRRTGRMVFQNAKVFPILFE